MGKSSIYESSGIMLNWMWFRSFLEAAAQILACPLTHFMGCGHMAELWYIKNCSSHSPEVFLQKTPLLQNQEVSAVQYMTVRSVSEWWKVCTPFWTLTHDIYVQLEQVQPGNRLSTLPLHHGGSKTQCICLYVFFRNSLKKLQCPFAVFCTHSLTEGGACLRLKKG